MADRIYALLVGINEYSDQVSNLNGCVNDIKALSEYLNDRFAGQEHQVYTQILLNQDATREAVIAGFRTHLGQAKQDDIALFAFSGHGSQEPAPPEYWHVEPDQLNETLVCWDSRQEGGKDLSDKELAQLIASVTGQQAQVTVILDCCHSGSGTRDVGRFLPADTRQHSIDSYNTVPYGRHILLSACRDGEVAKEVSVGGQVRGALSYHLLTTLRQANRSLSYHELYQRVYSRMKGFQSPQLEVTHAGDVNKLFLAQTSTEFVSYFTLTYDSACKDWVVNGGAVHGMPTGATDEMTRLAVYPFDSLPEALGIRTKAIGQAAVIEVMPQKSRVKFLALKGVEALRSDLAFKAVITDLPLSPVGIELSGDESGLERLRKAVRPAASWAREVAEASQARLRVIASDRSYVLRHMDRDRALTQPIAGYTDASAQRVLQHLKHIARWMHVLEMTNPAVEKIPADAINLQVFCGEQERQDTPMRLKYEHREGRWHQPQIRVKLTNRSIQPLYCALLGLSENYEISAGWFEAGGVWLQPGEDAWALSGKPLYLKVPKSLWQQGVTEFRDILKLIVSTAEFDARLLEQGELGTSPIVTTRVSQLGQSVSALHRLLNSTGKRAGSSQPEGEGDDWSTSQWELLTIRPLRQ